MDTARGMERLLGNQKELVFALCFRVLRHRQDAEDACQETLLKLARQYSTWRRGSKDCWSSWTSSARIQGSTSTSWSILRRELPRRRVGKGNCFAGSWSWSVNH